MVSAVSAAASARLRHRGGGSEPLAQPLTSSEDPFDVFRKDLMGKLDLVDESLAELLRIIHHTVRYADARTQSEICSAREEVHFIKSLRVISYILFVCFLNGR